jgi:hypothetical protein
MAVKNHLHSSSDVHTTRAALGTPIMLDQITTGTTYGVIVLLNPFDFYFETFPCYHCIIIV